MQIEYEITFTNVEPDALRTKIKGLGGNMTKPKTLMKRCVFLSPKDPNAYARIRDEGDKVTCTFKHILDENHIEGVKEIECEVTDFDSMKGIFEGIGVELHSYQETYREIREIHTDDGEIELMIDRWPGLKPYCEVEGIDEATVKRFSEMLGFNWEEGLFGTVNQVYQKELGLDPDYIMSLNRVTFDHIPWELE